MLDAREAEVLTAYALPSLLAPQNLPAMCRARRLQVEFYTAAGLAEPLRAAAPVQRLAGLAPIEVTPVAPEILASLERRGGAENPRHWIVGAFHYLAVEHARALAADVLYTPPERIYADGTLANFARFIDEGRAAVLLASLPGQAETLRPRLDELRDPATQALSISPRRLAELAMQNLHHTLKDCVLVAGNGTMPRNPTRLIFPHSHGFHVRSVQLYPVLISAAAIRKNVGTGPITAFDRASLESNFTNFFFPRPSDWQALKIVDDSDHGVALDIVPGFSEDSPLTCDLHFEQLLRRSPDDHHFWHFEHRVNFHAEAPIGAIGTFERSQDGALHRTLLPVADRSALADLDLWLTVKQPRPEAA